MDSADGVVSKTISLRIFLVNFLTLLNRICDTSIRKAICTIIWATPRVSVDVVEFKEVSKQLTIRYGKEFADDARSNKSNEVCPRVIHKLKFVLPDESIVNGYLLAIAEKYSVDWAPSPPEDEDDVCSVFMRRSFSMSLLLSLIQSTSFLDLFCFISITVILFLILIFFFCETLPFTHCKFILQKDKSVMSFPFMSESKIWRRQWW